MSTDNPQLAAADQEIARQDLAIRALTKQVKETGEYYAQEIERLTRERDALKYEPNGQLRANLSNDAIQSILDLAKARNDENERLRELLPALRADICRIHRYIDNAGPGPGPHGPLISAMNVVGLMLTSIDAALAPRDPAKERV